MASPRRLEPIWTAPLFPQLGDELVGLLRSLAPEDWSRPTVCSEWSVRDVAAHLLDSALRRISADRDDFVAPPKAGEVTDYESLVAFLNRLNAEWVQAHRRLSPRLLTDLLEWTEGRFAESIARLDPDQPARFAVSWAGEEESQYWFDVARELTERWLHQQQIRLAVNAAPLDDPKFSRPVFETFLRALPHRYRAVSAEAGSMVRLSIQGRELYEFVLRRGGDGWELLGGRGDGESAAIELDEQSAWLLLTKGMTGAEALARATVEGPEELVRPLFDVVAVMA